jgi:hypothetical protein
MQQDQDFCVNFYLLCTKDLKTINMEVKIQKHIILPKEKK